VGRDERPVGADLPLLRTILLGGILGALALAALVFAVPRFGAAVILVPVWVFVALIAGFGVRELREVWVSRGSWADAGGPIIMIILPVALGVLFTLELLS